jgi:hypothetical protein
VLFRYAPKVGPFKGMGFDSPTAKTEDLYIKSINATVDRYTALLEEVRSGTIMAPNCDLDDGEATRAAEYTLADEAYAKLLARLTAQKFEGTSSELRKNILDFYSDPTSPVETKKDPARWATVQTNLSELRAALPPPVSAQPATLAN